MAPITWWGDARLLRPLLSLAPDRLRATLRAAGDRLGRGPDQHRPAHRPGALRARGVPDDAAAAATGRARAAAGNGARRWPQELAAQGDDLPRPATPGCAAHCRADAWSALIWTVSRPALTRPGARRCGGWRQQGGGTLHGVLVGDGLAVREAAALAPPVAAIPGAVWDGRFALRHSAGRRDDGCSSAPGAPQLAAAQRPAHLWSARALPAVCGRYGIVSGAASTLS